MTKQLSARLTQATLSTFENLGFVVPEAEVSEDQASVNLAWGARVDFRGPVAGWVEVRLTDGVVEEIAANMLGIDGEVGSDVKRDAMGEIANVICGNVVPALGSAEDIFDLDAPDVCATNGHKSPPEGEIVLDFGIASGRAELVLYVDRDSSQDGAA